MPQFHYKKVFFILFFLILFAANSFCGEIILNYSTNNEVSICKHQSCIRKCCPRDQIQTKGGCRKNFEYTLEFNVSQGIEPLEEDTSFYVIHSRVCENGGARLKLQPSNPQDAFYVQKDGTLYTPHLFDKYTTFDNYCLEIFKREDHVEMAVLRCFATVIPEPGGMVSWGSTMGKLAGYITCSECDLPLSFLPIFSGEDKNICGRCPAPEGYKRNTAYELVALLTKFDCRHNPTGCGRKLLMREVPKHEKECPFRTFSCPVPDCVWNGNLAQFDAHSTLEHVQFRLNKNTGFTINIQTSNNQTRCYYYKKDVFVVSWTLEVDTKRLEFLIKNIKDDSDSRFYCLLTLQLGCYSYLEQFNTNKLKNIVYSELVEEHLKSKSASLSSLHVFLRIKGTPIRTNVPKLHTDNILKSLTCVECRKLAYPPLFYQKDTRRLFCIECRKDHDKYVPNMNVNNFAESFKYPCFHKARGCDVTGAPAIIEEHAVRCVYRPNDCFVADSDGLECGWEGPRASLPSHLTGYHQDAYIPTKDFFVWHRSVSGQSGFMVFDNRYFRASFRIIREHFGFMVQKIDAIVGEFIFVVEIINFYKRSEFFTMEQRCSDMKQYFVDYTEFFNYCLLHFKQADHYIEKRERREDDRLHLRIYIRRDDY